MSLNKQRLTRTVYLDKGPFDIEFYYIPPVFGETATVAPSIQMIEVTKDGSIVDYTSDFIFYETIETALYEIMEEEYIFEEPNDYE